MIRGSSKQRVEVSGQEIGDMTVSLGGQAYGNVVSVLAVGYSTHSPCASLESQDHEKRPERVSNDESVLNLRIVKSPNNSATM